MAILGSGEAVSIEQIRLGIDIANQDTLNSSHSSQATANALGKASDIVQVVVAERLSELVEEVHRLNKTLTAAGESNGHSGTCLKAAGETLGRIGASTSLTDQLSSSVTETHEFVHSEGDVIQKVLDQLNPLKDIFSGIAERTAAHASSIARDHLPNVQKVITENTKLKADI